MKSIRNQTRDSSRSQAAPASGRLRRYVAAPLLAIYCGVLCFAAMPQELVPAQLGEPHRMIRLLLWNALRINAAEEVFAGNAPDMKQRLICLTVFGVNEREPGAQTIGFQSFPRCEPPSIRLHSSSFALALNASVWLLLTPHGDMEQLLTNGPGDERLRAISRYFCASPSSRIRGSDEVLVVVEYHKQHYYTGEITKQLGVVHEHVCKQDVSLPRQELGFAAEKLGSGRILLRSVER